jgi:CRISPR-associated protein Cas1
MSWRTVVVSSRAKLELKLNYLIIRTDSTLKVHMGEIGVLVIESTAVSITAALLSELSKRKILVILCDEKRNPCSILLNLYGSYDCSGKLRSQLKWGEQVKADVWTRIVREKIFRQSLVLLNCGLVDEHEKLQQYLGELQHNDCTNREGHAAKVYFNSLFGSSFSRGNDSVINGALDYGYAIIMSLVSREVVSSGFNTQIGIFHDSQTNHFNLSCDLMEPLRPILDEHILNQSFMQLEELNHDSKMKILDLLEKRMYIDGKKQIFLNAVKIYVQSVLNAIEQQDTSFIRFIENEL